MVWRAASSYGCTWQVGRALKHLELLLAIVHLASWESTQKSSLVITQLGYRLERRLGFFRALPTSCVHPQLDGAGQTMDHFFKYISHFMFTLYSVVFPRYTDIYIEQYTSTNYLIHTVRSTLLCKSVFWIFNRKLLLDCNDISTD